MKESVLSKRKLSVFVFNTIWTAFEKVCNVYEENPKHVYENNNNRKREYVEIRYLTMVLIRETHPQYSLEKIGMFFLKDHSSVLHGIKTISNLMSSDKNFRKIAESILP